MAGRLLWVWFSLPLCQERLTRLLGPVLLCVSHSRVKTERAVASGHAFSLLITSTYEGKENS